jgi:hypothetical protein
MKRALLACACAGLTLALFTSCDDDSSARPKQPEFAVETHVIRDIDYVKDKYFYFDDPRYFIGPRANDPQINVYRTVTPTDLLNHPDIQRIPGWVMPDSIGDGQSIRDAAATISSGRRPDYALIQDFELLQAGVDYDLIVDPPTQLVVGIKLADPVPPSALKAIAVTYVNRDDIDTLMLEMLKAPDPRSQGPFGSAWRLAARNYYYLGTRDIGPNALTIVIEDVLGSRSDHTRPEGSSMPYLRIFGLDQSGSNGVGPSDGLIDAWYVDLTTGILQFPSVESFAPDPINVNSWTDGAFAFDGPYQAQYDKSLSIYEKLLNPTELLDAHQYIIKVTVKRPITPPAM